MISIKAAPVYDCDVLVVGGGPGGAATATYLAQSGWRVTLLDASHFPRDKVCGDFVGPVALAELERLGVDRMDDYPKTNVVTHAAFHLNGEHLISRDLPGGTAGLPPYGRVITRLQLDEWIIRRAEAAGVRLIEGCRLLRFLTDEDGVTATVRQGKKERSLRSRLLIAADGSNSTIGRQLTGEKYPAASKIVAVRAYCEGVGGESDRADLYFNSESFPGYYWLFPTGATTANLGVGMVLETLPPSEDHLKELLADLLATDPVLRRRMANGRIVGKVLGWPLATYDPDYPIHYDRILLVGDAAGLINSLNGEGIQYALLSGRWAAEAADVALRASDLSAAGLAHYREQVMDEIGFDLALSRLVIQFIRNRQLNPVWLKLLEIIVARARLDGGYADTAGGVLAGTVPAKDVLSPDFLLKSVIQGGVTLSVDGLRALLAGPAHWRQLAGDTVTFSGDVLRELRHDPTGYARWLTGLGREGAGFVGGLIGELRRGRQNGT